MKRPEKTLFTNRTHLNLKVASIFAEAINGHYITGNLEYIKLPCKGTDSLERKFSGHFFTTLKPGDIVGTSTMYNYVCFASLWHDYRVLLQLIPKKTRKTRKYFWL